MQDLQTVIKATKLCAEGNGFACMKCPYQYTEEPCERVIHKDILHYLEKLEKLEESSEEIQPHLPGFD